MLSDRFAASAANSSCNVSKPSSSGPLSLPLWSAGYDSHTKPSCWNEKGLINQKGEPEEKVNWQNQILLYFPEEFQTYSGVDPDLICLTNFPRSSTLKGGPDWSFSTSASLFLQVCSATPWCAVHDDVVKFRVTSSLNTSWGATGKLNFALPTELMKSKYFSKRPAWSSILVSSCCTSLTAPWKVEKRNKCLPCQNSFQ